MNSNNNTQWGQITINGFIKKTKKGCTITTANETRIKIKPDQDILIQTAGDYENTEIYNKTEFANLISTLGSVPVTIGYRPLLKTADKKILLADWNNNKPNSLKELNELLLGELKIYKGNFQVDSIRFLEGKANYNFNKTLKSNNSVNYQFITVAGDFKQFDPERIEWLITNNCKYTLK